MLEEVFVTESSMLMKEEQEKKWVGDPRTKRRLCVGGTLGVLAIGLACLWLL